MATNLLQTEQSPATVRAFGSIWGYTRHELIYLSWALMELALITPVILSILNWTRYWPIGQVTLWLLLLMLLPFNMIRLMSLLELPRERQRWIMVTALLVLTFLSLRTILHDPQSVFDMGWLGNFYRSLAEEGNQLWTRDIALFLITCFMWWRGIRLTYHIPNMHKAGLRFRVGGLLLAPLVIWIAADLLLANVMSFILLFFTAALTTIALIRAEETEQERTRQSASLTPQWVGSIFVAALGIVFTASFLATIISGQPPEMVATWVAPIWLAIRMGTTAVLTTAVYVASPILNALAWLVELIFTLLSSALSGAMQALQEAAPNIALPPTPDIIQATETPEAVGTADGTKIIIVLLMIATILLVTLALSRLFRQAVVASRDSENLDRRALDISKKPNLARRVLEKLGLLKGLRTAISIRRIYWQMCRAASGAGYPRLDVETPYEYLSTLAQVWPTNTADARLITQAYVKIRYGELPESAEELNDIRIAWRRLETTEPTQRPENEPI